MIKKIALIFSLGLVGLSGQNLDDWKIFTYMNDVNDVEYASGHLWVATTGGIYQFDPQDNSVTKFNNIHGLATLKITCIESDKYDNLISGSQDGIVHVKRAGSNVWNPYFELKGLEIADIFAYEDTLWIAAKNGLAVYLNRGDDLEFRDFYDNFPVNVSAANKVVVFNNRIFYATANGLLNASANFQKQNLKIADAWQVITQANGLPSDIIYDLAISENELIVGALNGASIIDKNFSVSPEPAWNFGSVKKIVFNGSDLVFIRDIDYFRKSNGSWVLINSFDNEISSGTFADNDNLWFGFNGSGIRNADADQYFKVDGPSSNNIGNLLIDRKGVLWMASGVFPQSINDGFHRYDFEKWTHYRFSGDWSRKNSTVSVYEDQSGKIWLGSWGGGITIVDGDDFDFYHAWSGGGDLIISTSAGETVLPLAELPESKRACLVGAQVSGSTTYTVSTAFIEDNTGNLWIANYLAREFKYFNAIENYTGTEIPDCSQWVYFGGSLGMDLKQGEISSFTLESFGEYQRIWMGTMDRGVLVFDHKNTITDQSDDVLYDNDPIFAGLFSNSILSLATDRDGVIWIGTDAGLNSYQAGPSTGGARIYKHVGETGPIENRINNIFVDANNNKWFATNGGLSILIGDKSPWDSNAWVHYTVDNSGLPSPLVNSVFVDPVSGAAYIGTNSGLAIFYASFAEIKPDLSLVTGGPNPFILSDGEIFTIKNLALNSQVKIFNISGQLVRMLNSQSNTVQGSRASWDGKDERNNTVPSGIYVYLVYNDEGQAGSGKIAVIRP